MTHVEILDAARDRAGGYKVDVSRGERIGRVSSEWFSRPADERYLSLCPTSMLPCMDGPSGAAPEPSRARRSGWRRAATMPSALR